MRVKVEQTFGTLKSRFPALRLLGQRLRSRRIKLGPMHSSSPLSFSILSFSTSRMGLGQSGTIVGLMHRYHSRCRFASLVSPL